MMEFHELMTGNVIWVNIKHFVGAMFDEENGCVQIMLSTGDTIFIRENIDHLVDEFNEYTYGEGAVK